MSKKFDYIVFSIEDSYDNYELSIGKLQNSLSIHEKNVNRSPTKEQALKALTIGESSKDQGYG